MALPEYNGEYPRILIMTQLAAKNREEGFQRHGYIAEKKVHLYLCQVLHYMATDGYSSSGNS